MNFTLEKSVLTHIKKINSIKIIRFFLLLLPFTFLFHFKATSYGYLSSKVLGLSIILIASLLIIILTLHKKDFFLFLISGLNKIKRNKIFQIISLMVFLTLLSTLNSDYIFTSFAGSFLRWDGFLTLFCIYLYIVLAFIFLKLEDLNRLVLYIIFVSIIIFFSVFTGFNFGILRPNSYIGNPIFLSQFFMLSLFFIFYLKKYFLNKKNKASDNIITLFFVIISIIGVIVTGTRGVFVGMIVATIILSLVWYFSKNRINFYKKINSKNISIIVLVFTMIGVPLFLGTKDANFWDNIPVFNRLKDINREDGSTQARVINNKISYNTFINLHGIDKFIGVGPEMYASKWIKNYDPELNKYEQSQIFDRAHNMFFDLLIMRGILGFLVFIYLIYYLLEFTYKQDYFIFSTSLFILTAYLIQGLFEFDSYTTTAMLFIIFLLISQLKNTQYGEKI